MALLEEGDQNRQRARRKAVPGVHTLTPILKKLEQMGYIVRQRSSADERQVRISRTAAGRKLLDKDIGGLLVEACGLGDEFPAVQKTVARLRDNLLRSTRAEAKTS